MFGYISPDRPYLFKKDEVLYEAMYCGLCKSIGKSCGQCPRTALSYDMAFVTVIVHNIRGEDVKIEKKRCIAHWFRRRPVANQGGIDLALGCLNTILAYYKLCDDKADGEMRGALRHLYARGFKRAKKRHPQAVEIIERGLSKQKEVEGKPSDIPDEAAEPTALMMAELSRYVLGDFATEHTDGLFYAIGKWIYFADALDDYDKDVKKGRYNVFRLAYKKDSKKQLVEDCGSDVKFALNSLFASMREHLSQIKFNFNHDLTDNIILRGIPLKSRELFYGNPEGVCKGEKNEQKKS